MGRREKLSSTIISADSPAARTTNWRLVDARLIEGDKVTHVHAPKSPERQQVRTVTVCRPLDRLEQGDSVLYPPPSAVFSNGLFGTRGAHYFCADAPAPAQGSGLHGRTTRRRTHGADHPRSIATAPSIEMADALARLVHNEFEESSMA